MVGGSGFGDQAGVRLTSRLTCYTSHDIHPTPRYAVPVITDLALSKPSAARHSLGHRFASALFVSIASSALVGCSSYRAPTFQVIDARVVDRTNDGAVVQFTIEAKNDNSIPIPLRQARYSMDLDGQTVFAGTRSPETTLHKSGTHQFVIPAAIKASSLAAISPSPRYRLSGSLTYITPGAFAELLFDTGVARPSAPFGGEGSIDIGPNGSTTTNSPTP